MPAVIAFSLATVVEMGAYYVPWVDNALDSIASPLAVIAGVVLSVSVYADMSPLLKWSLALIAGGGVAGACADGNGFNEGCFFGNYPWVWKFYCCDV